MQSLTQVLSNNIPRLSTTIRLLSNNTVSPILRNRNPRNLERLRIGYKPDGYHVESPGRRFWHKLELVTSGKYVSATITHFQNGIVLRASTQEWPIKKQLYRYKDSSAYVNLGRVLAQRCLESGLTEMYNGVEAVEQEGKASLFLEALQAGGVSLNEPQQFKQAKPWDQYRPERPWEITE